MKHRPLAQHLLAASWKGALLAMMDERTRNATQGISAERLQELFGQVMRVPVAFPGHLSGTAGREIFRLYYTAGWVSALDRLSVPADATVLEVAAGDTVYVPEALEAYSGGRATYVTANLNKELTRGFNARTAGLQTRVRVIADDATNLDRHCDPESFDVIAFQHAVNDIAQTIVADRNGIDTVENDWFEILPAMAKLVMEYSRDGRMESDLRPAFIRLMATVTDLLKTGGWMVFNNCIFQVDLDSGYEVDLYASLIDIARRWIAESDLPLEVVDPDWIDPQWWMIVRKRESRQRSRP